MPSLEAAAVRRRVEDIVRKPLAALTGRPKTDHPADIVRHLRSKVVANALSGGRPHGYVEFGPDTHFTCPLCNHRDFNLPSARLVDDWKWRCNRCDHEGTRYELERLLLDRPDAVLRMLALIDEWPS
jgi:hypothetical protein